MAHGVEEPHDQNSEIKRGNQQNTAAGQEGNQENVAADHVTIERSLEEKFEKKEEQILKIEASVFQLANYYFVFQGVILTAIIKGSSSGGLKCHNFWLPFSMSLIGAVLNFGSLFIIADKYRESLDQLDKRSRMLCNLLDPVNKKNLSKKHEKRKVKRGAIMIMSMILFLLFALLNLVATWIIPCRN